MSRTVIFSEGMKSFYETLKYENMKCSHFKIQSNNLIFIKMQQIP